MPASRSRLSTARTDRPGRPLRHRRSASAHQRPRGRLWRCAVAAEGEDFTVARVKRRYGTQSSVGMIYTRRATADSIVDPRHTIGADITIATPDFVGGIDARFRRVVRVHVDARLHHRRRRTPRKGELFLGWDASVSRDPYNAEISFKEVQPAYNAAVGFTPRRNYRTGIPNSIGRRDSRTTAGCAAFSSSADADINTSPKPRDRSQHPASRRWSSSSTAATASSSRCSSRPRTSTRTSRSATG